MAFNGFLGLVSSSASTGKSSEERLHLLAIPVIRLQHPSACYNNPQVSEQFTSSLFEQRLIFC
jgi:hypothetical protein